MEQDKWTGKEDAYRTECRVVRVRTRERKRAAADRGEGGERERERVCVCVCEREREIFEGSDLPQIAPFTGVTL